MGKKERTKEYLEGALDRARKLLNPRDYAMIVQAARASAGGQIASRNRRERATVLEKFLANKRVALSDDEVLALLKRVELLQKFAEAYRGSTVGRS